LFAERRSSTIVWRVRRAEARRASTDPWGGAAGSMGLVRAFDPDGPTTPLSRERQILVMSLNRSP
jgi:hypothetical protein